MRLPFRRTGKVPALRAATFAPFHEIRAMPARLQNQTGQPDIVFGHVFQKGVGKRSQVLSEFVARVPSHTRSRRSIVPNGFTSSGAKPRTSGPRRATGVRSRGSQKSECAPRVELF